MFFLLFIWMIFWFSAKMKSLTWNIYTLFYPVWRKMSYTFHLRNANLWKIRLISWVWLWEDQIYKLIRKRLKFWRLGRSQRVWLKSEAWWGYYSSFDDLLKISVIFRLHRRIGLEKIWLNINGTQSVIMLLRDKNML